MRRDFIAGWYATARGLSRDAFRIFRERGARVLCGSVAFYSLVSVVPILVIALRLATSFIDPLDVHSAFESELGLWVGPAGAHQLLELALKAGRPSQSPWTNTLGVIVVVYGSTRLFSQLIRALDLLWQTPPVPKKKGIHESVLRQLRKRGLAFGMVLVIGLLLCLLVLFRLMLSWARQSFQIDDALISRPVEALASFGVTILLFSLIYWVLPRARVKGTDALVGGVVTAVLFTLGSTIVTAYLAQRDSSIYGSAAAVVTLMLWVHYNAHAFFLGAAFTAAHAERRRALAEGSKDDMLNTA
jgi:membrane protein